MREKLVKSGVGARAPVIDALETMQYHQTTLMTQKGQLEEAAANIEVLAQERDKIFRTFISDNGQKYAEAARQADDYEQRLTKARAKREDMTLASPVSGVVMALSVTTLGQVVTTSEELMRIVPDDAGLEIECYLQNKDIGFVAVGQEAQVKIESFPFTRYGTIKARVTNVARDAIPEPDAQITEGDPAKATKSGQPAGAQHTQNLVFPVALSPDRLSINADGADIDLSPGMAVSVEIKTGRRRILDIFLLPPRRNSLPRNEGEVKRRILPPAWALGARAGRGAPEAERPSLATAPLRMRIYSPVPSAPSRQRQSPDIARLRRLPRD